MECGPQFPFPRMNGTEQCSAGSLFPMMTLKRRERMDVGLLVRTLMRMHVRMIVQREDALAELTVMMLVRMLEMETCSLLGQLVPRGKLHRASQQQWFVRMMPARWGRA